MPQIRPYQPAPCFLLAALALGLAGCAAGEEPVWPADQPPVAVENQLMGILVSGTVEAGGGYILGAAPDRLNGEDRDRRLARQAVEKTRNDPATVDDVRNAPTADLNRDGLITTDELIALADTGLAPDALLRRLEVTGYVFQVSPGQQDYLLAHDIDRTVVAELPRLNRTAKQRLLRQGLR
ncbi:MAG: hypothetical protein ACODAQ_09490 [Phycisphaeraceae bacterium]